ncbi:MAG: DEAD/DEAH box helicase family protein [Clostridia bacterium]|nr:DEAD/DEAH box helicase family protein [Clostridia bacterium]
MRGSKHLSELIDLSALKIDALNIVKAPTGSGKTYFALTAIPHSIGEKALWQVVYLIDTINGKDQILRNYNAYSYCKAWDAIATGETLYWGDGDESVVIMTYAKFGQLLETRPDFHKHFKYIICDEMPSAIQYQYFEKRPNLCSIALHGLERAVRNDSTTVIALTATPNQIPSNFDAPYTFIPIDEAELIHYTVDEVRKYTNLEYLIEHLNPNETGICYVKHITKMKEIEAHAA